MGLKIILLKLIKVLKIQNISILGIEFEVIEVPGHTLDHIAFII